MKSKWLLLKKTCRPLFVFDKKPIKSYIRSKYG